jgi:hypothetical protein
MGARQHTDGKESPDLTKFSEVMSKSVEVISFSHFLPVLAQHMRANADPWAHVGVNRATHLRSIHFAGATCKEWKDIVTSQTEYAALRLAQFDRLWEIRPRRMSADDFVVDKFDRNCTLLYKLWELSTPMRIRLRTAPMSELSDVELDALRGELQGGWGVEARVSKGADWRSMELLWVTPSLRDR